MEGFAQSEDIMVLNAIQEAKIFIAQKQYSSAKGRLDDIGVFGLYTDSINYYMNVIDYHIDLDSIEIKYHKKRFSEARTLYNLLHFKYKDITIETPAWVLRCDTIIEAQKKGGAVTPRMTQTLSQLDIDFPEQGFTNGRALAFAKLGNKDDYNFYIFSKDGESYKINAKDISPFFEHYALELEGIRVYSDKSVHYIDEKGNVLKVKYDRGAEFHEGLAAVRRKNKWGYINKSGEEVIPCKYITAYNFHEGLAAVLLNDEDLAFIDKNGSVVFHAVTHEHTSVMYYLDNLSGYLPTRNYVSFSEGMCYLCDPFSKIVLDTKGNIVFSLEEKLKGGHNCCMWPYSCGLARVSLNKGNKRLFGFIDKSGNIAIPTNYSFACDFSDSLAWVSNGKHYGCIDKTGKLIIDFVYDVPEKHRLEAYYDQPRKAWNMREYRGGYKFCEGLSGVNIGGKWGFVDNNGQVIVPFEYDDIRNFSEGFAWVMKKGKWGLVDKYGTSTFDYQ